MNWDQIEGKWDQMKSHAKSVWAKLTDDDLAYVGGKREKLVGKLQERYGVLKEHAQRDVDAWVEKVSQRLDKVGRDEHTDSRKTT